MAILDSVRKPFMKIKTRRYYIYHTARILFFLLRLIPRKVSLVIADFLALAAFRVLTKHREVTISNLNEVFDGDRRKSIRIAKEVFKHLAKTGVDWIKLTSLNKNDIDSLVTEVHGIEHLDKAVAEGKGVILLASHFGNWELLSIYLYGKGYKGAIVARRIYFHKYDDFLTKLRGRFGAHVIYRDESPKKVLRVLKKGQILGVLADQDVDSVDGVFVDFFGKPAYTPTAPVKLGMATGASLVPAFMIREKDNTYKLVLEEAISVSSGENVQEDVKRYTQAWTEVLERYIKQYPEQWVWVHPRWKSRQQVK